MFIRIKIKTAMRYLALSLAASSRAFSFSCLCCSIRASCSFLFINSSSTRACRSASSALFRSWCQKCFKDIRITCKMKMIKGDVALTKHIYSSQVDPWLVTRYASQNLNKNQISMISGFQTSFTSVMRNYQNAISSRYYVMYILWDSIKYSMVSHFKSLMFIHSFTNTRTSGRTHS